MPQTLLSLLALVGAAYFTFGQQQGSAHTLQSIIRDEFEVAVAGQLLHTVEFADSRAFDDATTPERLRARLGLPQRLTQVALDTLSMDDVMTATSSFADTSRFGLDVSGATARCNPREQSASLFCNDVSDFHDRRKNAWRDVTLRTPNGESLPVEVHVEVSYVESTNPDVAVSYRTNHKRVEVWARSPLLLRQYPQHAVVMRRVISFDPAVALEYLKRTTCVVSDAYATQIAAAQARLTAATAAADAARRRADTAAAAATAAEARVATATADARATATAASERAATALAAATAAEATANQRATDFSAANATAAARVTARDQALATRNAAWTTYLARKATHDAIGGNGQAKRDARRAMDDALAAYNTANTAYDTANTAATSAVNAATAAQNASTLAWNTATTARTASDQAARDAATATAAISTATTAAQTSAATARASANQAARDAAAADATVTAAAADLARLTATCPGA